jgi:hypothetical protein
MTRCVMPNAADVASETAHTKKNCTTTMMAAPAVTAP